MSRMHRLPLRRAHAMLQIITLLTAGIILLMFHWAIIHFNPRIGYDVVRLMDTTAAAADIATLSIAYISIPMLSALFLGASFSLILILHSKAAQPYSYREALPLFILCCLAAIAGPLLIPDWRTLALSTSLGIAGFFAFALLIGALLPIISKRAARTSG